MQRILTVCAISVLPGWVNAQSPEVYPYMQRIDEQKKLYLLREGQLRGEFEKKFDGVERKIRASTLDPQEKSHLLDEIQSEKAQFAESNRLPSSDAMLQDVWDYQIKIHTARIGLIKAYQSSIEQCTRAHDDANRRQLMEQKVKFDELLPGRGQFTGNATWTGSRHMGRTNATFTLTVDKLDNNTFHGTVKQAGHAGASAVLKVKGVLEGNYIAIDQTELVKGDVRLLQFKGFVLEDRIVLNTAGWATSAAAAGGIVNLHKK